MKLGPIALFDLVRRRTGWLAQRHQVLAQNVAHVDTPGYRARDLRPFAPAGRDAFAVALRRTGPGHLAPARTPQPHRSEPVRHPAETVLSGNSVALEDQLLAVARTALDHQVATNVYRKYVEMFRTALGRGAG